MKVIVGLGNPGAKYSGNRHNIGFMALSHIAEDHHFSAWKSGFNSSVCEGRVGAHKVLLMKPLTYMNNSGKAVRAALDFYKLSSENVTVFHDELDLAPGKCRFKQGGGHAGHNGLRSLHAHISDSYARVRLGIGHPGHKHAVVGYVLSDFSKSDAPWLEALMHGLCDGFEALVEGDAQKFQTQVALRKEPPRRNGA